MIASLTQTYGEQRYLEMELLNHDDIGKEFRNKCDYIVFSFHNCSQNAINRAKIIINNLYDSSKLIYLIHDNISYVESMIKNIEHLKKLDVSHMLLLQDDMFGMNNNDNKILNTEINDVFSFVKQYQLNYFNILKDYGMPHINKHKIHETITINTVSFYKFKSNEFNICYSYNDGAHFINLNFLKKMIDTCRLSGDVWNMEQSLNDYYKSQSFDRWGFNKLAFLQVGVHGRNTMRIDERFINIKTIFGFDDDMTQKMVDLA